MKRLFATFAILGAAALGLAAAPAPTAAQAPSGKLVIYTSQPQADAQGTVEAFRRAHPGVEVEFVRDGTTQVMSRLQAEFQAGAPQPDVLLIADAMAMEQLKAQGRLAPFKEAKVEGIPASALDPDRTYFGTKFITTGIIYNTKAAKRPESFKDLLAPEAKGQVVMPSPLYSGAAAIFMGTLAADPAFGPAFFEGLAANGAVPVQGNGQVRTQVAGGQKAYGLIVDFMALNAKRDGSPVDFVFPKEGAVPITEPVAILATARNVPAARAFVDFLVSAEGQRFAASQGYLPIRPEVEAPATFPPRDGITVMAPPLDAVIKADEANKRLFADLFGG